MSSINSQIHPQLGPILYVSVMPIVSHMQALERAGRKIPASQQGIFLLDTGANASVIDPIIIRALEIQPHDERKIQTPSTNGQPANCFVYNVQIVIQPFPLASTILNPGLVMPYVRVLTIIEANLIPQGIAGLIGRDVLEQCLFIYNGRTQSFTLSW